MRIAVVLPAPLAPRKPKTSPALHLEGDAIDGGEVAERARQVLDLDRELAHAAPRSGSLGRIRARDEAVFDGRLESARRTRRQSPFAARNARERRQRCGPAGASVRWSV